MLEYNFSLEDIDEQVSAQEVPLSFPNSLKNSRILSNVENYQSCTSKSNQSMEQAQQQKLSKKESRLKQLEGLLDFNMMKECTFRPKTNVNRSDLKKDFTSFLNHQKEHVKKVQEKTQKLYEALEKNKEAIKTPKNFQKGHRKQKEGSSVFDRLYEHKSQVENKQSSNLHYFSSNFSKTNKNVNKKHSVEKNNEEFPKKQINYINEQLIAKKFMKEYFSVLNQLQLCSDENTQITKQQFLDILFYLRFLKRTTLQEENSCPQTNLALQAYTYISSFFPSSLNIFTFLLSILGIYHINPISGNQNSNTKSIDFDIEEGKVINRKYNVLYRNRLCLQGKICGFWDKENVDAANRVNCKGFGNDKSFYNENCQKDYRSSSRINNFYHVDNSQCNQNCEENKENQEIYYEQSNFGGNNEGEKEKSFNDNNGISQTQDLSEREVEPQIILEVNFDGHQQQIVLKPSELSQIPQIASKFAIKYSMDEQNQKQLSEMLYKQIQSMNIEI